jgi:hypothetical protein
LDIFPFKNRGDQEKKEFSGLFVSRRFNESFYNFLDVQKHKINVTTTKNKVISTLIITTQIKCTKEKWASGQNLLGR